MKKLLPILFLIVFASCSKKQVNSKDEPRPFTFSFEIDTVQIDFKDRFYFMEIYLATAALSADKSMLFNLNGFNGNLEVIDLDKQELVRIERLDKEGPKGIGPVIFSIGFSPQNELMIKGMDEIRVFDQTRSQMKVIKIGQGDLRGDVLLPDERHSYDGYFTENTDYFLTIYQEEAGMSQGELKGLTIIDLNTSTIRKIPIPELDRIKAFYLQDQYGNYRGDEVLLSSYQNKVIVSTSGINEAFVYDLALDTLFRKSFNLNLQRIPSVVTIHEISAMNLIGGMFLPNAPRRWSLANSSMTSKMKSIGDSVTNWIE